MIIFKKIKYKNIMSIGNSPIEIDLSSHRTNIILGKNYSSGKSNGSGKSSLIEAITFGLYGKPFRKINKPQLINTKNKGELLVEIEFETDGKQYKVVRGLKPNIFEIYQNGSILNQNLQIRDYQEILENSIIKMSYKAFTHIVIIGNAIHTPFMQLTPADRRLIIENLLDIDIFSKMNNILKQKLSDFKVEINDYEHKNEIINEKMKIYRKNIENTTNNIDEKIEKTREQIRLLESKLQIKNENVNSLNQKLLNEDEFSEKMKKLKAVASKMDKLKEYKFSFESKLKTINSEISYITENDTCLTCKQDIDVSFKESFRKNKEKELINIKNVFEEVEIKINETNNLIKELEKTVEEQKDLRVKINYSNTEINFIKKEIQTLFNSMNSLLEEKRKDILNTEEEYHSLNNELNNILKEREEIINNTHLHSMIGVMLKDDGIKTKIIQYYLPTMNNLINKYLHMLEFGIIFKMSEDFSEKIESLSKETFSYNSFSEGEKMRIDLAILFTWREIAKMKNSANTNLLILDEVFDSSLDSTGIESFLSIINSMDENTNIFIISHKEEILSDKFDRTIRFEKRNGFTRLS